MSTPFDQAVEEAREAYQALQAARRNLAQTRYNHSSDSSSVILGFTPEWTWQESGTIEKALRSLDDSLSAAITAYQAAASARVRWEEEQEVEAEAERASLAVKYLDSITE